MLVKLGAYELINGENVIYWSRETMVWWFFIIDRDNGEIKLFRPTSRVVLHCTTGECDKPSTMSVNNYLLEISYS